MYTASVAARSAALNVGLQAPIEPMIHAWKEEIGTEYTVADSMFNLAAAGVLGGTISGAAANLGHRYSGTSFLSKNREVLKKQFIKEGFDEADADVLSEYQADINNAPDKGVSVEDHINRGEANLEDLNGRKNADYDAEPVIKEKDQITEEYEKYFGEKVDTEGKVIEPDPSKELYYDLGGEKVSVRTVVDDYGVDIESAAKIMECLYNG